MVRTCFGGVVIRTQGGDVKKSQRHISKAEARWSASPSPKTRWPSATFHTEQTGEPEKTDGASTDELHTAFQLWL